MFSASQERPSVTSAPDKKIALFSKILHPDDLDGEQDGILLENLRPPCAKDAEDALFENYRDIAESAFGVSVTVIAEYDDIFSERIRAILRSAVYGRFSLLLRGILCEKDLKNALSVISRVFCELEADGREFNGYIRRGICIDSPMLLHQAIPTDGIDTCVIDAERLISLMSNNTSREDVRIFSWVADEIKKATRQWSKAECFAILGRHSANVDFCKGLIDCGIYSFFVPKKLKAVTKDVLYRALAEM